MKDLTPRQEVAEGSRREAARSRGVRRRLFAEEEEPVTENSNSGEGGSVDMESGVSDVSGDDTSRGAQERRLWRWPELRPADQVAVYITGSLQGNSLVQLMAEQRMEARERWNFDFENEQPLEGQWQWEKMPEAEMGLSGKSGDPVEPRREEDCHTPLR